MSDLFHRSDPAPVLKGFSLWGPWGSLWLTERKPTETRHWQTRYRGWLAVHAAQHMETDPPEIPAALRELLEDEFGGHWAMDLPRGAIIGAVELLSCLPMTETEPAHDDDRLCGHWSPERFAWRRGRVVVLKDPIPFRGRQRIFNIPPAIAAEIMQQVPA